MVKTERQSCLRHICIILHTLHISRLTWYSSCVIAHNADTEERHRGLFAASFETWPQLHPRASISRSTDLLHVSFGRLLLFPAGVQRMATLGIDVGGILLTCPIHSIFITSTEMGSKHPSSLVELRIEYFGWPKDVLNSSNTLVLEHF